MLDHIGITVSNYQKAKTFYQTILTPLGYECLMEVASFAGFGPKNNDGPIAVFWIHQGDTPAQPIHIAFTAKTRKQVDEFYQVALNSGGKDNGKPGLREIYHPNYYGAFVLDFDGNNIEAVCHVADSR